MKVMARPARTLRGYFRSAGAFPCGRSAAVPKRSGSAARQSQDPSGGAAHFLGLSQSNARAGAATSVWGVAASAAVERGGQGVEVAAVLIDVVFEQLFQKRRHPKAQHHGIADLVAVAILGK